MSLKNTKKNKKKYGGLKIDNDSTGSNRVKVSINITLKNHPISDKMILKSSFLMYQISCSFSWFYRLQ